MQQGETQVDQLRAKAMEVLQHSPKLIEHLYETLIHQPEALIEQLATHQAELQVQNDELRRSQKEMLHYQSLFEALPILALVLDEKALILDANVKAMEVLGFESVNQLRQQAFYNFLSSCSSALFTEAFWQPLRDQSVQLPDLKLHIMGRILLLEPHITRLPEETTGERHYLLLLVDRTQEKAFEEQSQLYELLVNHARSLIYATDREHRLIFANDALLTLLKRPLSEVLGHQRQELMPLDAAQHHEKNDRLVLSTGKSYFYEEKLQEPGEAVRYFFSHKFPLYDAQGEVFGVGGITTEITENKVARQRLELAMQVFSQGTEGIMISDSGNKIISVNQAFEEITGYSETEVLGHNPRILASGRQDVAFYQEMWQQINDSGKWEGEIWNRRKSGSIYPEWLTINRVEDTATGSDHYIGVFSDITQRKLAEEEIERLAFYDTLTGAPNRYLLKDRFNQALLRASHDEQPLSLAFIDLDRFKEVNDLHGHDAGDQVLKEVVQRAQAIMRDNDTLARLSGDEFIWIMSGMKPQETVEKLSSLVSRLAEPYTLNSDIKAYLSASVGVAFYPEDGDDYETLLKNAELAMYQAKSKGKNTYELFNQSMAEGLRTRYKLEFLLQGAIERKELQLVFQPQFVLSTGKLVGLEALLRWQHPELGWIPPDQFIPLAEETHLINQVSDWVLEQVCQQMASWQQQGCTDFTVAINVSAKQFWSNNLVEQVQQTLHKHGLSPHQLELELTERLVMEDASRTLTRMQALKEMGVGLSIDDFGTGFSSLSYLRWMPVDVLKVDKAFVDDVCTNIDDETICRSIIQLGKGLGLTVIAEGVETQEQAEFLAATDCDLVQGYLFAKPMPVDEVTRLLCQQTR